MNSTETAQNSQHTGVVFDIRSASLYSPRVFPQENKGKDTITNLNENRTYIHSLLSVADRRKPEP